MRTCTSIAEDRKRKQGGWRDKKNTREQNKIKEGESIDGEREGTKVKQENRYMKEEEQQKEKTKERYDKKKSWRAGEE